MAVYLNNVLPNEMRPGGILRLFADGGAEAAALSAASFCVFVAICSALVMRPMLLLLHLVPAAGGHAPALVVPGQPLLLVAAPC
jgi:hypothetical protein